MSSFDDIPDPPMPPETPADQAPAAQDAPAAEPIDPTSIDVESLLGDLERVTAERDEYLGHFQRTTAEFSNFRKQNQKRQEDQAQQAAASLVDKLLPVLDACDAARLQGIEGVEPVQKALLETLTREGLELLDPAGQLFDPNLHDAVMTEPAPEGTEEPTVSEVMRTGYAWNGRVLRPAMVKVLG